MGASYARMSSGMTGSIRVSAAFLEEHSYFSPGKLERQANRFAIALLTAGLTPGPGESLHEFYLRAGIPQEMLYF